MNVTEEWRPIENWPEYAISNHGRLKRILPVLNRDGKNLGIRVGKILKPRHHSGGYLKYMLRRLDEIKDEFAHTLVLEAFVSPRPSPKHQCCHGDGDRKNNNIENLRWGLIEDNVNDAQRHGTRIGECHNTNVLTRHQVLEIRDRYNENMQKLADEYGVSKPTIWRVINRKVWVWLEKEES